LFASENENKMISDKPKPLSIERKVNYGLDAPIFQRCALFGGLAAVVAGLAFSLFVARGILPAGFQNATAIFWPGVGFFVTGCVMLWGSKVGKLQLRDKIISSINWRGDEHVLDVGCGHGLMLLAAAKRLNTGRAIGIDIWSQVDQANNNPESTMENARLENVADKVQLESGDARSLPFADGSFDVVVSSFAIHNLGKASDRDQVLREIARVLRPGGQLAIADIRHTAQYARTLGSLGWTDVTRWAPNFLFVTPTRVLRATRS
jgi:arsenite methyltransferase